MKEIETVKCPQCKRIRRFENNPSFSYFGFFCGFIFASLVGWFIGILIPYFGLLAFILLVIKASLSRKDKDKFYCTVCGTCVELEEVEETGGIIKDTLKVLGFAFLAVMIYLIYKAFIQ